MSKRVDCARHRGTAALQQCTVCQRPWCDACISRVRYADRTVTGCPMCHQALQPIDVATVAPTTREAPGFGSLLARPFKVEPLLTAFAIALPAWLSHFVPGAGRFLFWLGFAAAVAYYFQVIDHVGRGQDGMPEPTQAIEDMSDVRRAALRGILCIGVSVVPYLLWLFFLRGEDDSSNGLTWLLIGQFYMPAALLTVVITGSTAGALWPVAWVQIIARAPAQYVLLVGVYLVSIVLGFFFSTIVTPAMSEVPVVGMLLGLTLERILWFTQAALVGGFLAANAEKLGWD
jgi:hypothetical protein